jgi:hypothetical protein
LDGYQILLFYAYLWRITILDWVLLVSFSILTKPKARIKISNYGLRFIGNSFLPINKSYFQRRRPKKQMEEILTLTGRCLFWQALITEELPQRNHCWVLDIWVSLKFFQSVHTAILAKMTLCTPCRSWWFGFIRVVRVFSDVFFPRLFLENRETG